MVIPLNIPWIAFAIPLLFCLILPTVAASPAINSSISIPQPDWRIDHAVVVVSDLDHAIDSCKAAGFSVISGGDFSDQQTKNALIPFSDGSYIELFAPVDPGLSTEMKKLVADGTFDEAMKGTDTMDKRFMLHLASGPGVKDFALSSPELNLTQEPSRVIAGGLNLSDPIAMSRTSPDGVVANWHVDVPQIPNQMALPFLIADDTPGSHRAAVVNSSFHQNGATGIRSVTVSVAEPDTVIPLYNALLPGVPRDQAGGIISYNLNGSAIKIIKTAEKTKDDGPVDIILKKGETDTLSLRGLSF